MKETHSENETVAWCPTRANSPSYGYSPAPRHRHASLAGHAYQYFLRILYLSRARLADPLRFLQAAGFQWSGNAIRVAELIAFRGARAARRNGCGIWRHRPVGFPAPEEAGWITG
jgi:hypothetical protein